MTSTVTTGGRIGKLLSGLGPALIAVGLLALGLGWYGAAGMDWLPAQIPYLVSGGLGGLALLFTGIFVVAADMVLRQGLRRLQELEALQRSLERTVHGNGQISTRSADGDLPTVQLGHRTFHRVSCRYVRDVPERQAERVPLLNASAAGYEACKVCRPDGQPRRGPEGGH